MKRPSHFHRPLLFTAALALTLGVIGLVQPASAAWFNNRSFDWTYKTYTERALTAANAGQCESAITLTAQAAQQRYSDMTHYQMWCRSIQSRLSWLNDNEAQEEESCDIDAASTESQSNVDAASEQVTEICKTMEPESGTTAAEGTATTSGNLAEQAIAAAESGDCTSAVDLLAKARTAMTGPDGNYVGNTSGAFVTAQSKVRQYCATELMSVAYGDTEANLDAVGAPAAIKAMSAAQGGDCGTAARYLSIATGDTTLYKNGNAVSEQGNIVVLAVQTVAKYCIKDRQ